NGGAEVSSKPALFCLQASTGAPPDQFSSEGQDWSLPPLDPVELARDNFQHYIELLRANMAHCGALRIDHVMGMLRLWWCLPDQRGGAYVYYPMQTLLALLRLESHRNRCLVVGEDMGVVPDEVREAMAGAAIYSNKLFYFERDAEQQFKQPADYASTALLMVTNHDVPTLAGWWNGSELALRAQVGLLNAQTELPQRLEELRCDKHRLLEGLQMLALLPAGWQQQGFDQLQENPFDLDLCGAILRACAGSRAQLVSFQLEDLQLIEAPVNMPGSFSEYANWRRKQVRETSAIFNNAAITALLQPVYEARDH
ncbi:MAG: 4-alpha-glucanotransferase, partial [Pseudomonadales bacterium]